VVVGRKTRKNIASGHSSAIPAPASRTAHRPAGRVICGRESPVTVAYTPRDSNDPLQHHLGVAVVDLSDRGKLELRTTENTATYRMSSLSAGVVIGLALAAAPAWVSAADEKRSTQP
jgi:hypothetical protein